MPGIHTFLHPLGSSEENYAFVPVMEGPVASKTKKIFHDNSAGLYFIYHDGYPFSLHQTEDQIILFEGLIYNQPKNKTQDDLQAIARCFRGNGHYNKLVKDFIESADGEFLVEIWDNNRKRLLLFNDYWGRLPLYYYFNQVCGISREIKNLLPLISEIKPDTTSLVEFLYFEFPLGIKTLFKNVYRLEPACMIVIDANKKVLELGVSRVTDFNFDLREPFESHFESIQTLRELFLQSIRTRVRSLEEDEFQIVADLSGGFDSRAMFGGMEKFTHDGIYCVQKLNTNDQRKWGKDLFEAMDSPGKLYMAAPDHSYEMNKLGDFVYQYDCMANFSIGFNSHQVAATLRKLVPGKAARFMGFGGEFLRHPIKALRKSLIYGIDHGFYFYANISLSDVCRLSGVNYHDYLLELEKYLETYPEQTAEGQLKRLYFEYFNHYVNAMEDYCRNYFWTISPFQSSMILMALTKKLPLDWTGFKYFTSFMKSIDYRLLQTPIFGKRINLNSNLSVTMFEVKEQIKKWITTIIPLAHYSYKNIQARIHDHSVWEEMEPIIRNTTGQLAKSTLPNSQGILNAGNVLISRRYLSLLLYFYEIERHYPEKISF